MEACKRLVFGICKKLVDVLQSAHALWPFENLKELVQINCAVLALAVKS